VTRLAAVTFDAMGTLVAIEPPAPRLQQSLQRRLGLAVDLARCEAAMRVEMRHYRAHCTDARDAPALAALRLECASLLADALALEVSGAELLPSLTDAISFYAYPDAAPAVEQLTAAGLELAVVANWDLSLQRLLGEAGLASYFRIVVHAARKPAPDGLLRALGELRIDPARALHIGDDSADRDAAVAAGMRFASAPVLTAVATIL
jgi:FMN phosphatase YigB (HAD superfamily)